MLYNRLVSEKTVEENILKKANQKRLLGDVAIEGGNFTTAFFKEVRWSIIFVIIILFSSSFESFFLLIDNTNLYNDTT